MDGWTIPVPTPAQFVAPQRPAMLATNLRARRSLPLVLGLMDTEILADERALQRKFRLIYRTIALILLAGGCVALLWGGWHNSVRSGIIITAAVIGIAVVLGGLIIATGRRRPGDLASTGPWSWGQVYTGATAKQCWNAMSPTISRNQLTFRRLTKTTGMAERSAGLLHRKGHHLVDVRPSEDHPGWQVVTVQSAPDLPTTVTDFGRGRAINHSLLDAVPNRRTPEEMTTGHFPLTSPATGTPTDRHPPEVNDEAAVAVGTE